MSQDPTQCSSAQPAPTTGPASLAGAAYKACTASQATSENHIPTVQQWLSALPQLKLFVNYILAANLTKIPGTEITVLAPTDASILAAQSTGALPSPTPANSEAARQFVLDQIIASGGIQSSSLIALGSIKLASNLTVPTGSSASGNVTIGNATIQVPDVFATNGIIQIVDGLVTANVSVQVVGPTTVPVPVAEPLTAPVPAPVPVPEPTPAPVPAPAPVPVPVPETAAALPPAPEPAPEALISVPSTIASPQPTTVPAPMPALASIPAPSPPLTVPRIQPTPPPQQQEVTLTPNYSSLGGAFAGCNCSTNGMSGSVNTGQVGCVQKVGEQFRIPFRYCYTEPSCPLSQPSQDYVGAYYRLC